MLFTSSLRVSSQCVWGGNGYMSALLLTPKGKEDYFRGCGVLDFSGCGAIHMTGGLAAIIGAYFVGPRKCFLEKNVTTPTFGPVFQTLGVFMLWFGWYGFNCCSTLKITGYGLVIGKIAVTTTISAGTGALSCFLVGSVVDSMSEGNLVLRLEHLNNGVLIGLVAITAACSTVEPYDAAIIGACSSPFFIAALKLTAHLGIDDVVGAGAMHYVIGLYGLIMPGLFANERDRALAYGLGFDDMPKFCSGVFYGGSGNQLLANLGFAALNTAWVGGNMTILFFTLSKLKLLRVSEETEEIGLDSSEHGGGDHVEMERKRSMERTPSTVLV